MSAELPVGNRYLLRLPFADFRAVNGRSLEGVCVAPEVEMSKGLFGDCVHDAALAWLAQSGPPS